MERNPISQPAPKPSPKPRPIPLLETSAARVFTHLHPAILLSSYLLQFPSIVADPISALAMSLLPLALLQVTYTTICLPPTGTSSYMPAPKATKAGLKKKGGAKQTGGYATNLATSLLALTLAMVLGPVLLTIVLILFGAPITTHLPHTFLCACHMSLLAIQPLVYTHGVNAAKWRELSGLLVPVDEVVGGSLGVFIGAWLGAIPIPLDWDREWQKWPVTIVTGAYIGYALCKFLGGSVAMGRHINFG
ncbi:hypothetical protein P152DRAFT_471848 [Eremomyces bilateralis CBS 781.70]|uniref:Glycosylphosphatidylinositol anchor biosynthesis protein 11 n=1 Tax=Eremomyces bilateralis CBS 781.70 TaxID=1392243 RepID=A0A6G1GBF2_9PEZI|nr:uncharacterized protein P152DRAFT_471848 [Eremomyces bilateralis CBS 781.70]KAF1815231.1 hypothetical protein P152DRAFT_471848 [Eremomyces bilateralis CBS 781.70]